MRIAKHAMLAGLLTAAPLVLAEVPVIEIREAGAAAGSAAVSRQSAAVVGNAAGNEMVLLLQQLQDEVRSLRGTVEQQQRRITQLEYQQRDRYRDVDRRLSLLFQSLPADAALVAPDAASSGVGPQSASSGSSEADALLTSAPLDTSTPVSVTSQQGETVSGQPAAIGNDQRDYDAAYALIRQREFASANMALVEFINAYPDSALIPNAWYWKGEVHLAQQQNEGARQAFTQVLENYAGHSKAPDAMYKLGVLFGRSGDTAAATEMMRKVIETYPQSSAAELAQGYLTP